MASSVFDRETLLDVSVNIIPLGIMAFFVVLFLLVSPWGHAPFSTVIQVGLHLVPIVLLALLTYLSARVITRDEAKLDAEAGAYSGATTELHTEQYEERDPDVDGAIEGDQQSGAAAEERHANE